MLAVAGCSDSDDPAAPAPGAPEAIVSLSATHTEMLYALGAADQIAATDLTSDFPAAALETPKVDAFNFNVEEVAALDPDLVVLAFNFAGEIDALESLGIPSLLLPPPATVDEALAQVVTLGEAVGRDAAAADLAGDMRAAIDEAVDSVGDGVTGDTVFHEVDSTLFSANSSTYIGDVYRLFGLVNIADEVPDEFASGYVQLAEEAILGADPGWIFLGDAAFGEDVATVAARPGWDTLSAVAGGRVVELDSNVAGRWGPRLVELVESVAAALEQGSSG